MPEQPYHHGDLRVALLTSAERTLRENGTGALSLRELARSIGVSHAAPSRHFKDKQALLDALALSGFERLNGELEEASAAAAEGGMHAVLTALGNTYVGFAVDNPELLEIMYARKHDPDASEQLVAAVDRLMSSILQPIADGQAGGVVVSDEAVDIAVLVAACLHGIASFAASGAVARDSIAAVVDRAVGHLLHGLTPR